MTVGKVTIRQLVWEESDIHQILEIENASFNKDDAYSLEDFERWYSYNPDFCIVAEIDGKIVGNMICRIQRYSLDLASCAIHPDYRRSGIGSLLLNETEIMSRKFGIRKIYLEVRKSNASAQAFWQKMGFEILDILPGFYADGEEALRMRKSI
jgi:ribosomal-protein-alanine N-acetyltransferase